MPFVSLSHAHTQHTHTQCVESNRVLGWSYMRFDQRMQEENNNTRRKKRKWYKVYSDEDEDDDTPQGAELSTDGATSSSSPQHFMAGAPITIVDADGIAMAHGNMVDDEPEVSHQPSCAKYDSGTFKLIKLNSVVRGCGTTILRVDEVFDGECMPYAREKKRRLDHLLNAPNEHVDSEARDGFYIWHEYVKPRIRASRNPASTAKPTKSSGGKPSKRNRKK
jgi:hypothetical protein